MFKLKKKLIIIFSRFRIGVQTVKYKGEVLTLGCGKKFVLGTLNLYSGSAEINVNAKA